MRPSEGKRLPKVTQKKAYIRKLLIKCSLYHSTPSHPPHVYFWPPTAPGYFAKRHSHWLLSPFLPIPPAHIYTIPTCNTPYPAQPFPCSTCHHEGKVKALLHRLPVNLIGEGRKAHILLVVLMDRKAECIRARGRKGPRTQHQPSPSLLGLCPRPRAAWSDSFETHLGPPARLLPLLISVSNAHESQHHRAGADTRQRGPSSACTHACAHTYTHVHTHTHTLGISRLPPRSACTRPLKGQGGGGVEALPQKSHRDQACPRGCGAGLRG